MRPAWHGIEHLSSDGTSGGSDGWVEEGFCKLLKNVGQFLDSSTKITQALSREAVSENIIGAHGRKYGNTYPSWDYPDGQQNCTQQHEAATTVTSQLALTDDRSVWIYRNILKNNSITEECADYQRIPNQAAGGSFVEKLATLISWKGTVFTFCSLVDLAFGIGRQDMDRLGEQPSPRWQGARSGPGDKGRGDFQDRKHLNGAAAMVLEGTLTDCLWKSSLSDSV